MNGKEQINYSVLENGAVSIRNCASAIEEQRKKGIEIINFLIEEGFFKMDVSSSVMTGDVINCINSLYNYIEPLENFATHLEKTVVETMGSTDVKIATDFSNLAEIYDNAINA